MGGFPEGDAFFFKLLLVAIAAGAFLPLGIDQLLGLFVVFVVTLAAFILLSLGVPVMEGFVHTDRCPGRHRPGGLHMALATGHRPAFFTGGQRFGVAGNTVIMIDSHGGFTIQIRQSHVLLRKPLLVIRQVTGRTILAFFLQGLRVLVMAVYHRGTIQPAEAAHGVDHDNIGAGKHVIPALLRHPVNGSTERQQDG